MAVVGLVLLAAAAGAALIGLALRARSPAVRIAMTGLLGAVGGAAVVLGIADPRSVIGDDNRVAYDALYVQMISESGESACFGESPQAQPGETQICVELSDLSGSRVRLGEFVRVGIAHVRPPFTSEGWDQLVLLEPITTDE